MTAQSHNRFVFCTVVVEFAVKGMFGLGKKAFFSRSFF